MTTEDHLRAAFKALLAGDLGERDRQAELAQAALEQEQADGVARLMAIDFFVTPGGEVIPLTAMMARA